LTENVLKDHNIEILLTDQYPGINSKDFKNFLKKKMSQLSSQQLMHHSRMA